VLTPHGSLSIRQYADDDFKLVETWWHEHHGNVFCKDYVPEHSYIIESDKPLAFFGMCHMTKAICYFSFPLVNPSVTKEERGEAIDYMIECAKLWCIRTGHKVIYISIKGEKMLSRLEQSGFIAGEDGCKHMFCKLGDIA